MLHKAQKERQIGLMHALFVKRQDERAAVGLEVEIGILDALGDALEALGHADIVIGEQGFQIVEGDFGVDRHDLLGYIPAPLDAPGRSLSRRLKSQAEGTTWP